jgi:hypothetical protein
VLEYVRQPKYQLRFWYERLDALIPEGHLLRVVYGFQDRLSISIAEPGSFVFVNHTVLYHSHQKVLTFPRIRFLLRRHVCDLAASVRAAPFKITGYKKQYQKGAD